MPRRTCLGCRSVRDKTELVRLVSRGGELEPDFKGGLPGRGSYICPNEDCLKEALKKRDSFSRALKQKVVLPEASRLWAKIQGGLIG